MKRFSGGIKRAGQSLLLRDLNEAPNTVLLRAQYAGERHCGAKHPAEQRWLMTVGQHRLTLCRASEIEMAGEPVDSEVARREVGIGPGAAIGGDRSNDDPGLPFA